MSFVGEACLSTFFKALFAKLGSSESLHFATKKQVCKELRKWEKILKNIQAVLDDAEEKQMKDRHVKIWLVELQDLAYDVDDILDEFATEALGTKLMQERQANRSKVWKIIHTLITIFNPYAFLFNYKMMSKIKAITVRLQDFVTQKSDLHLRKNDVGRPKRMIERPLTTSLVNEALVYGREEDKKAIIDLLLMNDSSDGKVTMIPIVGIGGIGKTTLVQLVHNDNSIKDHFNIKAWVCVSEDFDVIKITKTILQSITTEPCNELNHLNLLQVKLKEELCEKNFLLVLDDI
ncbi:PREDICTED: putative disease resistance RPP13-like protein 1 [Theobroma cacao]|uniref:Disease resistance RPP13-like protein 1 n=1 Tax=Theobroma cacao TaxID=3641 RepID=A0AB32WY15_THECC|nr:PREDICTED: putative disease resistance RPP13-like protein 1 [Theobroma cacao]